MNEFYFHLKNINGGYENACYWVAWLMNWQKKNKKNKIKYEIEERDINEIKSEYRKDCIWLIWEIILEETKLRDTNIKTQIQSLYYLFKKDYTSGKCNARLPLIYHGISYLTFPIKFNIPLRKDRNILLQTQCNINLMFKGKKNNEVKTYTPPLKKSRNISNINKEINLSKINTLIEYDLLKK